VNAMSSIFTITADINDYFAIQAGWLLEIKLRTTNNHPIDSATLEFDDLSVVNKTEEIVLPLENGSGDVVLRLTLLDPSKPFEDQLNRSFLALFPKEQEEETVQLKFQIHYNTSYGEILCICGSIPEFGKWSTKQARKMCWKDNGNWELEVVIRKSRIPFEYKYIVYNTNTKDIRWEAITNRGIQNSKTINVEDEWEGNKIQNNFC